MRGKSMETLKFEFGRDIPELVGVPDLWPVGASRLMTIDF